MKASAKRALSLIGTAGLFVFTLAVYSLLLRPSYQDVNKMRGEFESKRVAFDEQSKIITKVRDLIAQYQGTAKIQDTIALTLPAQEATAGIVSQLQGIASASGIIVQAINVQEGSGLKPVSAESTKGVSSVGVVVVSASVLGTYDAFKEFIHGVETNIRVMDVEEWRVAPSTKGSSVLTFQVVINAYYQAE